MNKLLKEISFGESIRWSLTLTYWIWLTYLLLNSNPWHAIHGEALVTTPPDTHSPTNSMLIHLTTYGLLAFLLTWSTYRYRRAAIAIWFIIAALHGIISEYLQQFVPNRCAGFDDAYGNEVGLLIGWYLSKHTLFRLYSLVASLIAIFTKQTTQPYLINNEYQTITSPNDGQGVDCQQKENQTTATPKVVLPTRDSVPERHRAVG